MEWVSGNIFIRPMCFSSAGDVVHGHTHNFDHTTIFFIGSFHVKATLPDGRVIERDFHAPAHALIRRDVVHEITALTDGAQAWCVYAHRTPQGDVVQENIGWEPGYV